jgi:hypothetical protein
MTNEKLIKKLIWMEGSINSLLFVANDQGFHDALDCIYEHVLDLIREVENADTKISQAS